MPEIPIYPGDVKERQARGMPSILLLDCLSSLPEKLKRQGFDVNAGSVGFCTGIRYLPCQLYEKDIIIYNPSSVVCGHEGKGYISTKDIRDVTPEYSLTHLREHILRGATILIFVNHLADNITNQNEAYNWIPYMPEISFTKDHKVIAGKLHEVESCKFLAPIISRVHVKIPVTQKLHWKSSVGEGTYVRLFFNMNNRELGVFIKRDKGSLIILPQYECNEEIVSIFLHRVMPKLYDLAVKTSLIEEFASPQEENARRQVREIEENIGKLNAAIEEATEELNSARRNKIQAIKRDQTATLILNYYDLALQQDDVALFYLYKVAEALEKKYGGEREAKKKLGHNTEWNLIGKVANASYADVRHAPKPGEKIREWTQEEIDKCFKGAKKIIHAYLATLF